MSIRKHGSATGEVTGIEGEDGALVIYDEAARLHTAARQWGPDEDAALAAENAAADQPARDDG